MSSSGVIRWALYVGKLEGVERFAQAVVRAGNGWKPLAVAPARVDDAIEAVQPDAIVVATDEVGADQLLRHLSARHAHHRVVLSDGDLPRLAELLSGTT